jgi:glyceraldehyde-3-phosphate dehydrogenase/erythrose-4-phosphate dehydrogenase
MEGLEKKILIDGMEDHVLAAVIYVINYISRYDNEWGFSNSVVELTRKMAAKL